MADRLLRVAFVSHESAVGGGGAERFLLELVTELRKAECCEVVVVVPRPGEFGARLQAAEIPVVFADHGWWCTSSPISGRRSPLVATRQGLRLARRLGPWSRNMIHALQHDVAPDVICSNTAVIPTGALAAARMHSPHVWLVHEFGNADHGFRFFLGNPVSKWLIGASSAVVVCSSNALAHDLSSYVPDRKLSVVPYGIETPLGSPITSPSGAEPLRLVLVGRPTPSKGQADAIHALGITRGRGVNARLRLVGVSADEAYGSELRELTRTVGVADAVEIPGYCEDNVAEIDRAHVGLMCSRAEAFGRVTVEYQRRGRPVIGTRSGATPDLVQDGMTGLLYQPGDTSGFADQIQRLAQEPALLAQLSRRA